MGFRYLAPIMLAAAGTLMTAATSFADVRLYEHGAVATLISERLQPGDEQVVAEFLDQPRATPIRIIYLESRGGNTQAAMAIGRLIREHNIDTAFHVGHGRCVSACTTMFVGGVHRYYIGSQSISDGAATHLGLGFHPSNAGDYAESQVMNYYEAMGVPGAAEFRYRLYNRASVSEPVPGRNVHTQFFAGGRSALRAGVATSLQEPEDRSLRD